MGLILMEPSDAIQYLSQYGTIKVKYEAQQL